MFPPLRGGPASVSTHLYGDGVIKEMLEIVMVMVFWGVAITGKRKRTDSF